MHNIKQAIHDMNQDTHNNKPSYRLQKVKDPVNYPKINNYKSQYL